MIEMVNSQDRDILYSLHLTKIAWQSQKHLLDTGIPCLSESFLYMCNDF